MSVSTLHLVFPGGEKPLVRFELTTHALRMRCSTPELQRQMLCAAAAYHTQTTIASLFLEKITEMGQITSFQSPCRHESTGHPAPARKGFSLKKTGSGALIFRRTTF